MIHFKHRSVTNHVTHANIFFILGNNPLVSQSYTLEYGLGVGRIFIGLDICAAREEGIFQEGKLKWTKFET